jgi:hypothetical protein
MSFAAVTVSSKAPVPVEVPANHAFHITGATLVSGKRVSLMLETDGSPPMVIATFGHHTEAKLGLLVADQDVIYFSALGQARASRRCSH